MRKKLTRKFFLSILSWKGAALQTAILYVSVFVIPFAVAGPPFKTDDPETLEYKHGEFYVASQYANDKDGVSSTAPHFKVNYGILPNIQLHLLVPFGYDRPRGKPTLYGFQDLELGVKYRFIQEKEYLPMVGTFPILHLPTGNESRGLGSGETQFFLPLWLQKSWGPWLTYGGGGCWINPGPDNQNYWFFGWVVQREITKWLSLGAELFYQTPPVRYGEYQRGYTLGTIINFTKNHHLLCSGGSDFHGPNLFSYYVAYQYTWGPPDKKNGDDKKK